ncbi:hypothetical protein ES707_08463 [subsurface metagenome]
MQQYGDQLIRFNPYAMKKTGLLPTQTLLKLDDYMLICAPFQLSMKRAILLVILSKDEISFFQQFQNKIVSLSFTFQRPGNNMPINLFVRGSMVRMGPVKGRNNVCLVEISYSSCPNDLMEIVADYIGNHASLKSQYEHLRNKPVELNEENIKIMRYNSYTEVQIAGEKRQVTLISVSVNQLIVDIPAAAGPIAEGSKFIIKLYFQMYQFMVTGRVSKAEEAPEAGFTRAYYDIEFTPELVEILDDYFFRLSFKR